MKKNNKKKYVLLLVLAFVFILGVYLCSVLYTKTAIFQKPFPATEKYIKSGINIINLVSFNPDDLYFSAQVRAPSIYYATSDGMLDPYDTQGGLASPRLILMKDHQVLGTENYYNDITKNFNNDCIVIWSTKSMGGIESWIGLTEFNGELTDKEIINVEQRKAEIYKIQRSEGENYVGILEIGDTDSTSYYFHTCNTDNKSDFINVIKSLKFRGDMNFD